MKKLFVLALASLFTLSACGKKADEPKPDEAKPEAAAEAKAEAPKMDCSGVNLDAIKALAKFEDKNGRNYFTADSYVEILSKYPCCQIDEEKLELNKNECVVSEALKQIENA